MAKNNNTSKYTEDWVPIKTIKNGMTVSEPTDPTKKEHECWGTRCFNYEKNEVQCFLVSNAMFLLDKFHIDGIRVDAVASMLYLDYGRENGQWKPNYLGTNIKLESVT